MTEAGLPAQVAVNTQRLSDHERRIGTLEEAFKQNQEMLVEIRGIKLGVSSLTDQVCDLNRRMREHELEPAEKWRKLVWYILTAVASALVTFLITSIGLGS